MNTDFFFLQKNILIISPEPWEYLKVSKHHYAMLMAEFGNNVYFLNPPNPTEYKSLNIYESEIAHLYIVNYPGQLKGKRFLPAFLRRKIDQRFLKKFEALASNQIDIIWNFENSRFFDMDFAGDRLKIYHQVDLNQDFHIKEAATSADICFCTTDYIKNKILVYNKSVYKIHHGVSQEAFSIDSSKEIHYHPVATLVGNLDIPYLDHELLLKLVTECKNVHFNFIGSYDEQGAMYQLFSKYKNVQYFGKVISETIKNYLSQSDVLLVCYKADQHKDQLASPHKMMEYFASGKVIVATYTDEYKDKEYLLLMSESKEEYVAKFKEAINNLSRYNSPERQAERISFALEHTYSRQLEKINELLKRHLMPVLA